MSERAYPPLVRWAALVTVAALALVAVLAAPEVLGGGTGRDALLMLGAAFALVALAAWFIWTSHTRFDGTVIEQRWIWNKRVALDEVAQLKLVALPGLDAVIAPRLIVRTRSPGVVVIHCANREVLLAFAQAHAQRLAAALRPAPDPTT